MAGTDRSAPADLSAELTERRRGVRLLRGAAAARVRASRRARAWARPPGRREERLRLGQEPQLAFPSGSIAGYAPGTGGLPDKLAVLLFGLFGSSGPLPLHLTVHAMRSPAPGRRRRPSSTSATCCSIG